MDAVIHPAPPDWSSDLGQSRGMRPARVRELVSRIGAWWPPRRQVVRRLGVPNSSFRHDLQQHRRSCQDSRFL